ncbi:MAG TPA: ComEC/Rec2 family competence protein [Acidothermaceae bacterium]|nr:ComEC/Rec2 family competence protein [Acidothermaceae bacterium]
MTADVGLLAGERPDLRLLSPACAAWASAYVALGWSPRVGLAAALAWCGAAALSALGWRRGWALTLAAAALCAAGAAAAVAWRLAALQRGPLPVLARAHAKVTLELVIGADPRLLSVAGAHGGSRSIVVFPAKAVAVAPDSGVTTIVRSPVFVLASGRGWLGLQPSQHAVASGRLGAPKPGEFESATFDASGPPMSTGRPTPMQRLAGVVRSGLRDATAPLPAGPGGLLPGLVDGDVSRLPPQVVADFKTTGLTHLVAVSGANVAIVLGAVLTVARWVGLRSRGQALAGAFAIVGFVVVARPQPSVLRAAAMGLVVVVALAAGRRRRALPALCAAVLLLVCLDPTLARSVGFALSVLATGALLVVAPPLRERFARRMPRWLAEALAVPTAATLVCAPVIASFAGQVSLAAVPANLLAEPAVAPATILGVITACVAPWWTAGAQWIARVAALPCGWLVWVARTFARFPGAAVSWPTGVAGAVDLGLVVLLVVFALRLLARAGGEGGA